MMLQNKLKATNSPVVFALLFPVWAVGVVARYGIECGRRAVSYDN